ncbi:MAG: hypothetical protein Q7R73_02245 [bacterium]|nr:hypothetical protein [bacterium]
MVLHKIQLRGGKQIVVERKKKNVFVVVDDNFTAKNGNRLGDKILRCFEKWDSEVEDLDRGFSDTASCFKGSSEHLKWQDVDLTPNKFVTSTLKKLKEAFSHVTLAAYCPGDL